MLHFLICDDVTGMVAAMRVVTKNELGQLGAKATIHTFTDTASIGLSDCDIALLYLFVDRNKERSKK